MDARCWYYLKSWITLQPLAPTMDPEMSFYTEFWELIHCRFNIGSCTSRKLDYSPLQFTYDDLQEPPIRTKEGIRFALDKMCLDSVPKLRQAIRSGMRGKDLGTALLDDFQI
ncbi:hypothetical protein DL96DRAFT_1711198 [Flagelloscypha sp. PMI_526]|nr:hypothetical protein DL96DRAFT_1711198 [Flagelloscypha sp. PMI_526]